MYQYKNDSRYDRKRNVTPVYGSSLYESRVEHNHTCIVLPAQHKVWIKASVLVLPRQTPPQSANQQNTTLLTMYYLAYRLSKQMASKILILTGTNISILQGGQKVPTYCWDKQVNKMLSTSIKTHLLKFLFNKTPPLFINKTQALECGVRTISVIT